MKKYGLGIIGFGGMANHHAEKIAIDERLDIIGVYDIDEKRCEVAKAKGFKIYESVADLLKDSAVDIVLVATPNNFHKKYSIMVMEAHKHVICEKPVTMDSDELTDIEAVSKKTGMVFTVHQNRRMDKDFLMVKQAISDNLLGNIFSIESRVQGARGIPEGWRAYKVAGGGMMLDWGVHLIDQIMLMIDKKVESVYAIMLNIKYKEVDDYFKLLIRFEGGISAHVEVSTCSFITLPRWYVEGDNGTLIINDWNCDGKVVRAIHTEEKWEEEIVYTKAGPTKTMAPRRKETTEEIILTEPDNDYTYLYKNLIDCIEGTAPILVTIPQAMRVMKVMEAAFRSGETGEAIKVNI